MEFWLLTNTTYGSWLPGDRRWSYTDVSGETRLTDPQPALAQHARKLQKGPTIQLTEKHAKVVTAQFHETCSYRGWELLAVSVMADHFHLVVKATRETDIHKLLVDLKAYGSRALNREFGKPRSGTWWTKGGSKRRLPDEQAISAAIHYVRRKQPDPLATWSNGTFTYSPQPEA